MELSAELSDGPLCSTAVVRYCRPIALKFRVGLELIGLTAIDERRIARLVGSQDRRASIRAAVATSVEYRRERPGEIFHSTSSTDISLGGIKFTLVSPCEVGDRLELLIMFGSERISVAGTVVRIATDDVGLHAAVCFDPPSTFRHEDLQTAIRQFLDEFPRIT